MNGSMDIASVPIWQAAAFLYQHLPNKTRYVQIASITETQILRKTIFIFLKIIVCLFHQSLMGPTVWSSELDTLLMRYGVKFTSYRIKSVSNSLDQTVMAYIF